MIGLKTSKQRFNLFYLDESELYTEDFSGYCVYKSIHTDEEHLYPFTLQHTLHLQAAQYYLIIIILKQFSKERGKFHICSRTLIFESDNPETPLMKFGYRAMIKNPILKQYKQVENSVRTKQDCMDRGNSKMIKLQKNQQNRQKISNKLDENGNNKRGYSDNNTLGSNKEENSVEILVNKVVEIDTSGPPSPYIHHDFEKAPYFTVQIIPIYDNVQRVQQWISQLYEIQKRIPYSGNPEEEIQQVQTI